MTDEELREIFREVSTAEPCDRRWPGLLAYGRAVAEVADGRARRECAEEMRQLCYSLEADELGDIFKRKILATIPEGK
jgi:hypothetical protein